MAIFDVIIIYLACGAPFGMYQMVARRPATARNAAVFAAMHVILWPFFAASALIYRGQNGEASSQRLVDDEIDRIRIEMEKIAFANSSVSLVFEFREVFYRYAGLSEAANAAVEQAGDFFIAELSKGPDPQVAAACIARRNREILKLHQTEARNDFVDAISFLLLEAFGRSDLLSFAVRLAKHVKDADAIDELNTLYIAPSDFPIATSDADPVKNSRVTSTTA
jgi:hypothetical protein